MAEPKINRTVAFSIPVYQALEKAAEKRGESITHIILEAIRKDLKLKD